MSAAHEHAEHPDSFEYEKLHNGGHGGGGGHDEGEPWLLSYADMVTLLMCFFILFFATDQGNVEVDDPAKLKELLDRLTEIVKIEEKEEATEGRPSVRMPASSSATQRDVTKALEKLSKSLEIVFTVAQPEPGRFDITFLNSNFFKPGQAVPTAGGRVMVESAAQQLVRLPPEAEIQVHGHTDSDPIKSPIFPSNWELSSARASAVLKILAEGGLPPGRMRAVGFAHFRPVAPDKTRDGFPNPANKALNRRVVISVTVPSEVDVPVKNVTPRPAGSRPDPSSPRPSQPAPAGPRS